MKFSEILPSCPLLLRGLSRGGAELWTWWNFSNSARLPPLLLRKLGQGLELVVGELDLDLDLVIFGVELGVPFLLLGSSKGGAPAKMRPAETTDFLPASEDGTSESSIEALHGLVGCSLCTIEGWRSSGNDHTSMTAPLPVCSAKLSMLGLS